MTSPRAHHTPRRPLARAARTTGASLAAACALTILPVLGTAHITGTRGVDNPTQTSAGLALPAAHAQNTGTNVLRIQKHSGEGDIETGHAPELPPLPGIRFQINKLIGMTATSQVEISDAVQKDPYLLTEDSRYQHGPDITATTNAQGIAEFTGLDDGVYLVRELTNRTGETQYSAAAPFLVALPNGTDKQLTVRAKNQQLGASLTILGGQSQCRTRITFAMDAILPAPDRGGKLYKFAMRDNLPQQYEFIGLTQVAVRDTQGKVLANLEEGRDYTLTLNGQTVDVALTEAGLATAAKHRVGHPEARLRIVYDAKILPTSNQATYTRALYTPRVDTHIMLNDSARSAAGTDRRKPWEPQVETAARTTSSTKISNTAEVFVDGYQVVNGGGIGTNPAEYDTRFCKANPTDPTDPSDPSDPTKPSDPANPGDNPAKPESNKRPGNNPADNNRPGSGQGGDGGYGIADYLKDGMSGVVDTVKKQAERLASTGATVLVPLLIAAVLIILGAVLVRRRNKDNTDQPSTQHSTEENQDQ